jgi:hypothetical protein
VPASENTLFKRVTNDSAETLAYQILKDDAMKKFVPHYSTTHEYNSESLLTRSQCVLINCVVEFIEIEDLSRGFRKPAMMDVKVGCRYVKYDRVVYIVALQDIFGK